MYARSKTESRVVEANVSAESEVMSELAPLAAAPSAVRAPLAVVAPVPPKLRPRVVEAETTPEESVVRMPEGEPETVRLEVDAVSK